MGAPPDDWRRQGQEEDLRGLRFTWKRYQAYTAEWEHEHCEMCRAVFLDAEHSEAARAALADPDAEVLPAGYANLPDADSSAGHSWICARCFADFAEELGWEIVEGDPEAWPYAPPEPRPRPTAADLPDGPRGIVSGP